MPDQLGQTWILGQNITLRWHLPDGLSVGEQRPVTVSDKHTAHSTRFFLSLQDTYTSSRAHNLSLMPNLKQHAEMPAPAQQTPSADACICSFSAQQP